MEDFVNPPAAYRGTPFWAWNCRMTKEKATEMLEDFKRMGMGGAYIHSRTGMDMPYLGDEFMDMVRFAHKEADRLGLLTCLYDEDRWPSGYGGGLVTADERYRSRFLVFSPKRLPLHEKMDNQELKASAEAVLSGNRKFLACYEVKLEEGWLAEYRRADQLADMPEDAGDTGTEGLDGNPSMQAGWKRWYAYLEICGDNPWFNNQAYVDTLNPEAIRKFIEVTYEAYEKVLGEDFGKTVPVIFTDEPQFSFKTQFGYGEEETLQTIPYTDDFEETYKNTYGEGVLDFLPEIFWEFPGNRVSVHRYRYHDHICQRFTESYADQIGAWCREHHILLTGHMMREPFLEWQTMALGEAMRSYRSFDVPGIDMLCDRRELTTAKQAQSAVHQYHTPGMTSELYGVTNWDFDFRGHKLAGDWQAALGVTRRVHHLTWTSMAGEAKRDYPASIGRQSPWYLEYPYIETYFSRLNVILTRGEPVVRIGVIHPIESYWLYWGTKEHTAGIRREKEENFVNLVQWLLYGLMDFDFISESLLADFEQEDEEGFQVGAMKYDVVLVPDCVTLRSSTVRRLKEFSDRGGRVVFAGRIPELVDARPDAGPGTPMAELAKNCRRIRYSREAILEELDPVRILDIRDGSGERAKNLLYQMRKEGDERWLFVAHSEKMENPDLAKEEYLKFSAEGIYRIEKLNPLDGSKEEWEARHEKGRTVWEELSFEHDSFLYHLLPVLEDGTEKTLDGKETEQPHKKIQMMSGHGISFPSEMPVSLAEPNVLLIDRAEFAFDGGIWQPEEDILRIDNQFRRRLGLPLRMEALPQPWVQKEDDKNGEGKDREDSPKHVLSLRMKIESSYEAEHVSLGLEEPEKTDILWNGECIDRKPQGCYVDKEIRTITLGRLKKGTNVLECRISFDQKTAVENMYLLGEFGVCVSGRKAWVTEPVERLTFGDICGQGLPFYGGTYTYQIDMELDAGEESLEIQIPKFRAPVIRGTLDGTDLGLVAFSPYCFKTGPLKAGTHRLLLTVYGNRVNTFGPVHNCNQAEKWIGPNAWRTEGTSWSYEYQLKPVGILTEPMVWKERG